MVTNADSVNLCDDVKISAQGFGHMLIFVCNKKLKKKFANKFVSFNKYRLCKNYEDETSTSVSSGSVLT